MRRVVQDASSSEEGWVQSNTMNSEKDNVHRFTCVVLFQNRLSGLCATMEVVVLGFDATGSTMK